MSACDLQTRITGAVLFVLVGAGVLTWITDHRESPPRNPTPSSVEILAVKGQSVIDMVDLRNGNLHVEIPIRAARQETAAPLSHQ